MEIMARIIILARITKNNIKSTRSEYFFSLQNAFNLLQCRHNLSKDNAKRNLLWVYFLTCLLLTIKEA